MDIEHVLPQDIEKRSMQIIEEELGEVRLDPDKKDIIKRVIHTSADLNTLISFDSVIMPSSRH